MKTLLKFILIIIWMCVINGFSSQVGADSSKTSGFVVLLLTRIGLDLNSLFGNIAHLVLRKSAHMFVYFMLVYFYYNFFKDFLRLRFSIGVSFTFTFLFACLDEYHQTFVPNRAGSIVDVGIDMIGAVTFIILLLIYRLTFFDKKNSKTQISHKND